MATPEYTLKLNGKLHSARDGQTILEAAQEADVALPHDCDDGICEACRVKLMSGSIDDAGTLQKHSVLACKAKITGDCEVAWDGLAEPVEWRGRVCHFQPLANDLVELDVRFQGSPAWMTGQYFRAQWKSGLEVQFFPCFSLDRPPEFNTITFHLWPETLFDGLHRPRNPLKDGKAIKLFGPFGTSFLRFEDERLILIADAQGFTPIWSIAMAACRGQPLRPKVMLVERSLASRNELQPAFSLLNERGVRIEVFDASASDLTAHLQQMLPDLTEYDVLHAAGTHPVLKATKALANGVRATLHPIPLLDPVPCT
ncbi:MULTISPECIES: 2Fe-2S iron-sulfur cluster-binding protein [Pseudovibrio]|uniref:2Fe-2S iron-sulfur cluster-binding protein n=1 Tax=Stappiaceae TaxID=2821832 RepID=UPI002365762C|nr:MULTISPECIES: 2Fe-2S iron-sulfur cluster-binding protein [Pseudovibrio]MDD7909921.1 2Fe-2S iron-sulfur cluster-binding protein [Pseudovibrio exalbescens]MDX5592258.1 2Fe-2S iron-sulfur cluster-binding protein [Pseudovibrio sp. SPO723]